MNINEFFKKGIAKIATETDKRERIQKIMLEAYDLHEKIAKLEKELLTKEMEILMLNNEICIKDKVIEDMQDEKLYQNGQLDSADKNCKNGKWGHFDEVENEFYPRG